MVTIGLWILWTLVLIDVITISSGFARWRPIVYLQSVTPLLGALNLGILVVALVMGDQVLLGASAVLALWTLGMVLGLLRHRQSPTRTSASTRMLRIAHSNLLHSNPLPERAMNDIFATGADVIAFSEITVHLHSHAENHELAHLWPHRVHDLQDGPRGIALWSRFPLPEAGIERLHDCRAAVATVQVGSHSVRVLAVHPMAPVSVRKTRDWEPSLRSIGAALRESAIPAVAIGDYNATHWHPPMRRLYRAGLHSAHLRLGRLFAATFPVGRRLRPFVVLDHAVVTENIVIHHLEHVHVSGSDHQAIIVDISTDVIDDSVPDSSHRL